MSTRKTSGDSEFDIPKGAVVVHNQDLVGPAGPERIEGLADDAIVYWRNPPEHSGDELHPDHVPGYEPRFDRGGLARRVLGTITDEVDVTALGPRNTLEAITFSLASSRDVPQITKPSVTVLRHAQPGVEFNLDESAEAQIQEVLQRLVDAGLAACRPDGAYEVTADGLVELKN